MVPQFVALWVKFRTSIWYLFSFLIVISAWIVLAKIFHIVDNPELTYLNLAISIITELQAVVLLIYVARITEQDKMKAEEDRKTLNKILGLLDK